MFSRNDKAQGQGRTSNLSFIGTDVTIAGNVGGSGNLHIEGSIDGDVRANSVILGTEGRVKGNIIADDARIAGTVEGTVSARALVIEATARITGDLSFDTVSVANGAQLEGRVKRLTREDTGGVVKLVSAGD